MTSDNCNPKVVLFAEDDVDDLYMCQRAVRNVGAAINMRIVPSALGVIKWLEGQGQCRNRDEFPMPELIVTDLKTPELSGIDLLRWIRGHPQFDDLPVIVHSGFGNPNELHECRQLGATACITKNSDCTELTQTIVDLLHLQPAGH